MNRLFILLFLISFSAHNAVAGNYTIRNYSVQDGLANSTAYCIKQDFSGFIWIGTASGLNRFDGKNFEHFTRQDGLPDNEILNIFPVDTDEIWFVCNNASLGFFNGKVFKKFYPSNSRNEFKGNQVHQVFKDGQERTWIIGPSPIIVNKNLSLIDSVPYTIGQGFVYFDQAGQVYYFSFKGLFTYRDGSFHPQGNFEELFNYGDYYTSFHNIILKTSGLNFKIIRQEGKGFRVIRKEKTNCSLSAPIIANDGKLWIGTLGNGVYLYEDYHNLNGEPAVFLKGKCVGSVTGDKEGNIWVATLDAGIFKFSNRHAVLINESNGLVNSNINSIAVNNSRIYLGYIAGEIDIWQNGIIKNCQVPFINSTRNLVTCMTSNNTNVIVGTDVGIFNLNERNELSTISGLRAVKCIHVFSTDEIFFGTYNAAYSFNLRQNSVIDTIFNKRTISILAGDSVTCHMGSLDGYYIAKKRNGKWITEKTFINERVNYITNDYSGNIWIATASEGVFCLKDSQRLFSFNKSNGLASNLCKKIVNYKNTTWVITNDGLSKIAFDSSHRKFEINNYTEFHGLASNQVNDIVITNDSIFVATSKGLTILPSDNSGNFQPPRTYITKVYNKNVPVIPDSSVKIKYFNNNIVFYFTGINLREGSTHYQYMMQGIDDDWKYTYQNRIEYGKLIPGNYEFRVRSANDGMNWSREAIFSFEIIPEFYQTGWFRLVSVLLLVTFTFLFFRHRIASVKKREKEINDLNKKIYSLELVAIREQMKPHFIFNSLNSIQHFILNRDADNSSKYLANFSMLLRKTLNFSKKNSIPLSEEIGFLQNYIEMEKLRFENKFNYEITVEPQIDTRSIEVPSLIIQPFVENAINHGIRFLESETGFVGISFKSEGNNLACYVNDNGIGITKSLENKKEDAQSGHINSSKIIMERIDSLNKIYGFNIGVEVTDKSIHSPHERGTIAKILIPV